jgi:hypothetical protein
MEAKVKKYLIPFLHILQVIAGDGYATNPVIPQKK